MKRMCVLLLTVVMLAGLCTVPGFAAAEAVAETEVTATMPEVSEMFTDRDMEGDYDDAVTVTLADGRSAADGEGVSIKGDVITVTGEGTYLLTGTLSNGQIVVSAADEDKVQLVLSDAHITCQGGAVLYVLESDKVFVTLAEGTENTLTSAGEFLQTDENTVDGAIFSKSDLVLNGFGTALITCETGHGIVGKDDLKLTGGTWVVDAWGKGLEANDSFRMGGGDLTITAGADGVQVENEDLTKGYIYIENGTITAECAGDGISATGVLHVAGGALDLTTTGTVDSAKGLKSDHLLEVSGGTVRVTTSDDGLHTNGDIRIIGGDITIGSMDDAVHADNTVEIAGGRVVADYSFEGVEGSVVLISGGYVSAVTTDDGINAGGGADGSGFGGRGSSFGQTSNCYILISGGEVHVDASGDGLDANGALYITGGEVYVNGPATSFNGTLDSDAGAYVTGGIVVGTGPNSWLTNFGNGSSQGSILATVSGSHGEGTEITLADNGTGEVILSYTAVKDFQAVLLSAPELVVGGSYTLTVGDETQTVEMTSLQYGAGGMGGKGGFGGRGGKGH